MRSRGYVMGGVFFGVVGIIAACNGTGDRPDAGGGGFGISLDSGADVGLEAGPTFEAGGGDSSLPPCFNGRKDGNETDVDCGGATCITKCAIGKACEGDGDCADGAKCDAKVCTHCGNGKTDGDETDIDCGGSRCGACSVGKQCKVAGDCRSNACTATSCACPPNMTIVAKSTGGAYCVDTAEVTKGQYNKFITANVPVTTQIPACAPPTNTTFVPRGAWPPQTSPGPIEFNLGLPVHYVDWCDAYAYCKWAKKELCGSVDGGSVAQASANDNAKDAWYNACTAQGNKLWPYGNGFDDTKCGGHANGGTEGPTSPGLYGFASNEDGNVWQVATSDTSGNISGYINVSCQGGSVGLYQMSGNVAEWEDSCDATTTTASCLVRGGSYNDADAPDELKCNVQRSLQRVPAPASPDPLKDVGFRCCIY